MDNGHPSRPRASVKEVWQETPRLLGIKLELPAEVALLYTRPGQYVALHPDGQKPVFMAIASKPGAGTELELLVGPQAAERLGLQPGGSIAVDPPAGKGYPIEIAEGKDLLLFAVGTGMSAIRSVIEYVRHHRASFGNVVLYTGARSEHEHAYRDEEARWRDAGIKVVRAVSKPWVQDLFRKEPPPVENAVAFVCGMKDMVRGVTEALIEAGMPANRIRENY